LSIFVGALGLPKEEFECAIVGFKGNPTIIFNTKSKLNFNDKLPDKPECSHTKRAKTEKGQNNLYNYDGDMRVPNSESSAMSGQRRGQGSKTTVIMESQKRSAINASTPQVTYNQYEELTQEVYHKSKATETSRRNDQSSGLEDAGVKQVIKEDGYYNQKVTDASNSIEGMSIEDLKKRGYPFSEKKN